MIPRRGAGRYWGSHSRTGSGWTCGRPAQIKASIEPLRGLYDLRHTYATFALRAGIPIFAVPPFMGSRIAMIDRHYGHLAYVSRDHAVALLTLVF